MTIYVIGLNHTSASLILREQFAYAEHEIIDTLLLLTHNLRAEVALLSTCNRTELYIASDTTASPELFLKKALNHLALSKKVSISILTKYSYTLYAQLAVNHIYRVASGLDSMVLGETQILGQMKVAMRHAQTAATLGAYLHYVFQHAFSAAKTVRTQTAIGASSVSLAAAAVRLAQKIFGNLSKQKILMVGAGEMIELCMTHFLGHQPKQLTIANRSIDKASALIAAIKRRNKHAHTATVLNVVDWLQLSEILVQYDIIISCTASTLPIINVEMMRTALKYKASQRLSKTTMMVDLAVPRDIAMQVGELADIYLYTIDDLGRVVQEGRDSRSAAVIQAEKIIAEKVVDFLEWQATRRAVPIIQAMQHHTQTIRQIELKKALNALKNGRSPEQLLEQLAQQLTQKISHSTFCLVQQLAADNTVSNISLIPLKNCYTST